MAYELIKKTIASTASATLFFTNIPQTYKTLKIVGSLKGDLGSGARNTIAIAFNSDTNTSNYKGYEWYYEDGTLGGEFNNSGTSASRNIGAITGPGGNANQFGAFEMIIPNYANTTNYKVLHTAIGSPNNATTGYSYWDRGNTWLSNSAINSITFNSNANIVTNSTIWLYGLK
jgi:hypothetical protein